MFGSGYLAHIHWESACRRFLENHNIESIAVEIGTFPEKIRNKLDPEHPCVLSVSDLVKLVLLTGDTTLIDGLLAQLDCLPSSTMPFRRDDFGLQMRMLKLTADVGVLADEAINLISGDKISQSRKDNIVIRIQRAIRDLLWFSYVIEENYYVESRKKRLKLGSDSS